MKVKIVAKNEKLIPEYKTPGSGAADVRAFIGEKIVLKPFQRVTIPTGIKIQCPPGYRANLIGRSGLGINHGITLSNCVGVLDNDFVYEVKAGLINLSNEDFVIEPYDRVAQLEVVKYEQAEFELVDELAETERKGGLGHTGLK